MNANSASRAAAAPSSSSVEVGAEAVLLAARDAVDDERQAGGDVTAPGMSSERSTRGRGSRG
jgi:hypothetical protein